MNITVGDLLTVNGHKYMALEVLESMKIKNLLLLIN